MLKFLALAASVVGLVSVASGQTSPRGPSETVGGFDWQQPHAQVLPNGDLKWTPKPYEFVAGRSVRYIDFDTGNDANPGTSRERPWKHHPWDPDAAGVAKSTRGAHTYVFKRGVTYRGVFRPNDDRGTPDQPIRLTSDPAWGEGEARIYGSQVVSGWQKRSHPRIPEGEKVWSAEVDFLPRAIWMTAAGGKITRLRLARDPNWEESDPNDLMREWPTWENPEWWKNGNRFYRATVNGVRKHMGIDTKRFTRPAEDYVGATVWSEWGIVMGSPYPAKVEAFDEKQKAVVFRGPWTFEDLEVIIRGNRYHLEDMPWMLDQPGEFWVEREGNTQKGRIFLRLPNDADPNTVTVEAGRHIHLLDASRLEHVHVRGLTFRFTNVHWDYNLPRWAHPDLVTAVVRLTGPGRDVVVEHNTFEHVHMPVRISTGGVANDIDRVAVRDNVMAFTDHGAVEVSSAFAGGNETRVGHVGHVEVLRNRLHHIGWRILSGEHGHAININFPETSHIAGNHLHRIAGWGISVFGGKPSHGDARPLETPLSRHLIHHNHVEDALLKSNDWGAIETWQGGPFYIFNNVVKNPVAFKHWTWREGDPESIGSFGHAYYFDGSFKNYLFNNIGAGRNNTLGTRSVNTTAIQNIFSFENWFFNNTFFRFAEMTRQQAPRASRFRYLGNVIDDVSRFVFRHTDPKDVAPDPNASHYKGGGQYAYSTLAYTRNVFHNVRGRFGAFEETGAVYPTMDDFKAALAKVEPQADTLGVVSDKPVLSDPAGGDFRPVEGSAADGNGVRVFIPWGLYATVGEWQFTRNNADPAQIIDEHWFMTAAYRARDDYYATPRFPLQGVNITATDFVASPLSDWSPAGALKLDGQRQYLRVPAERLKPAPTPTLENTPATGAAGTTELPFATVRHPRSIVPGKPFEVIVTFKEPVPEGQVPSLHVHWLRSAGWGGFSALGGNAARVQGQANTYRFRVIAGPQEGLASFSLLVFLAPEGSYDRRTQGGTVNVPAATDAPDAVRPAAPPPGSRTVDVATGSFLVETYLQTSDPSGVIAQKLGTSGYALDLSGGKPRLRLVAGGQTFTATARTAMSDGQFHHLLVEIDRTPGKPAAVRFHLDGKTVESDATGSIPAASLSNDADFLVAGGPDLDPLAATLAFLRVSLGTLTDARTTIEELHAWQFTGPHLADFTGRARTPANNDAGAIIGER